MKVSGVYEIVNIITGDCYIGSSNDLEKRKKEHFYESYWKYNQNKSLYKDMKQYGKENFLFKTIQLCDPEELKKYEQIAIEKYNPKYNRYSAYTGLTKEEYNKHYRKENADSIKQHQKQYYKEHADSIKQQMKQYRKENTDSIKQYYKQYYKEHADSIKQQMKQYRKESADKIKRWHKENADSIKKYQKQYYNQKCLYENELLTLSALRNRFVKKGIKNPTQEAKKYLIVK